MPSKCLLLTALQLAWCHENLYERTAGPTPPTTLAAADSRVTSSSTISNNRHDKKHLKNEYHFYDDYHASITPQPRWEEELWSAQATGAIDLEPGDKDKRMLKPRIDGPDCATWVCPSPTDCPAAPASPTTSPPKSPDPVYGAHQQPPGPYAPSDCKTGFNSNMHFTAFTTPNCTGDSIPLGWLRYYNMTFLPGGFRSFQLGRNVGINETLAFFDFGVARFPKPGGGDLANYNWACAVRAGGILHTDTTFSPRFEDCWDVPSDGFALCVEVMREWICTTERNSPPIGNVTDAPPGRRDLLAQGTVGEEEGEEGKEKEKELVPRWVVPYCVYPYGHKNCYDGGPVSTLACKNS